MIAVKTITLLLFLHRIFYSLNDLSTSSAFPRSSLFHILCQLEMNLPCTFHHRFLSSNLWEGAQRVSIPDFYSVDLFWFILSFIPFFYSINFSHLESIWVTREYCLRHFWLLLLPLFLSFKLRQMTHFLIIFIFTSIPWVELVFPLIFSEWF